ncbi:MAG: oligosaccharide flippase family protein [Gemmatimonadaceae bacterium]
MPITIASSRHALLRSGLFRSVATVFGGMASSGAIGFITTLVVVRHLRPADYGVFAVLDTVVGISGGLLVTGFNWSMIRSVAATRGEPGHGWLIARRVLTVEVVYALFAGAALFLAADVIATRLLHHASLAPYVRLCSIGVLGSILYEYRRALFQAFKEWKLDAAFGVAQSTLYLGIVAALLVAGALRIRPLAVAYIAVPLLFSVLALVTVRKRLAAVSDAGPGAAAGATQPASLAGMGSMGGMARSYGWLLCYTLCLWLVTQVHMLVVTRHSPLAEIGVYGFAYKLYGISLMLMSAVRVVLLPTFSELSDRAVLARSFWRAFRATTAISVLWLLSIPFIGLFVGIFAGGRYAAATPILQVFMVGAATSTMLSPAAMALVALEEFVALAMGSVVVAALNIAGHLLITPRYGGVGAAGVQVLTHLVLNAYFLLCVYRRIGGSHVAGAADAPAPHERLLAGGPR